MILTHLKLLETRTVYNMSLSLEDRLRLAVMDNELAEVIYTTSILECFF